MNKIKVKPVFGTHQIYQEIANYPPENVQFEGISKNTKEGDYYQKKKIKEKISVLFQKFKIPRIIFVKPGNYDLIHSSRGIIPLNRKPWVMDIEHVHSFFGLNPNLIKNRFWRKFIEKKLASKYCRGILCHCEATRQSFFHFLDCSKFKEKINVLYPASHLIPLEKEKHKKIRILCVLSLFPNKSGLQVLKAFSELEKKYKNIELWIKSDVPEEIKKKYNSKNIKYFGYFTDIISREKLLKEFYSKCDIFLYPSLCDSFGYSMIDALVSGLPIISTNLFAFPEIVKEGENGYLIKIPDYDVKKEWRQTFLMEDLSKKNEKEIIRQVIFYLDKLIKNKKLRDKMGKKSFKKIKEEDFSIKERNKKLKEIYEKSLK